ALAELEAIRARLARLAGLDWAGAPGQVLLDGLRGLDQVTRPLEAVRARVIAAAKTDASWALDGSKSLPTWLERHTGAWIAACRRQVRTAVRLTQHLPATIEALAGGRVGVDHCTILVREVVRTSRMSEQLRSREIREAACSSRPPSWTPMPSPRVPSRGRSRPTLRPPTAPGVMRAPRKRDRKSVVGKECDGGW